MEDLWTSQRPNNAAQGFVSGSNGFPGFPDYTAGTWTRANVAVYGDVELHEPDDRWIVGGALRVERFDVFGATTNGKVSARYGLGDVVSVRGGINTGFRAPTPGQQNTFNVQSTINPETLDLVDSATVPSTYLAAQLRGGRPLDPETSTNATAGLVVDTGPFTLTADYFHIDVNNRLALSQNFTLAADERALLLSEGITSARTLAFFRFFINDFSTRTRGPTSCGVLRDRETRRRGLATATPAHWLPVPRRLAAYRGRTRPPVPDRSRWRSTEARSASASPFSSSY